MSLGRGLASLIPQKKSPSPISDRQDNGAAIFIETNKIVPNSHQPRRHFSDEGLEELAASVKRHGILQPIVVSPSGDKYELIAGERRLRAARLASLRHIPAIVRHSSDHEKLELALIENLQRENLNPIEEAAAYQKLLNEFNLTQEDVAGRVGKSRPVVANTLRLLNLPDNIQEAIFRGKISASAGRVLAGIEDKKKQADLFKRMLAGLTVREGEFQARRHSLHARRAPKEPLFLDLEEKLREKLETKVEIKKSGRTGKLTIEFYSNEELKKIGNKLLGKIRNE